MYAAISPSDPTPARPEAGAALARAIGGAVLGLRRRGADTVVSRLEQRYPCRIAFPRTVPGEPFEATLVTTSGGLAGGDSVSVAIGAGAGTASRITTQAAEKIYRSLGPDTRVDVSIDVADGAWLEWLPHETILFDRARLRRTTDVDVADDGRCLLGEIVVLGREAHGESFRHGLLHDAWRIRRAGRLVWADTLRLAGAVGAVAARRAALDGARALATVLLVARDAQSHVDEARELLDRVGAAVRCGVTAVGEVLVVRFLGADPFAVRRAFGAFWMAMRARVAGLPPRLPVLWHI